ncbi:MAG: tetratricopeptide repeat protein [Bacteroidetes bacterium]|nr:tetratricopeptide repeat protein [Bacteroidota bacterium]
MIKHFVLSLLTLLILTACGDQDASQLMDKAKNLREKGQTAEALALFEEIARDHENSPEAPEAMYVSAQMYFNEQRDPVKAATTYELIAEKYPESSWAHRGLFSAAYTYANDIRNLERARIAYERYLTQYPDSSMAATAQFELENLGKSPEELLESMQVGPQPITADVEFE